MGPDLELALRLADAADALSLGRFRARDLVVETKPDRTPVTEADREVERALKRLSDGGYGRCIDCDEPIPAARLHAYPAATRCIRCQEAFERRQG